MGPSFLISFSLFSIVDPFFTPRPATSPAYILKLQLLQARGTYFLAIFMDFLSMCQVGIFKVQILQVRITARFPARSVCEQRNTNNIENRLDKSVTRCVSRCRPVTSPVWQRASRSRGRDKKEKAPSVVCSTKGA